MEAKPSPMSPHMIKRMTDSHQTKMTTSSGGYAKNNSSIYSTGNTRMGLTSPSPPPQSVITAAAVAVVQQQQHHQSPKPNQVSQVLLHGIPIVSLYIESRERLCLAQISNTLLKQFSYNEIHNRRVALGITCVQCTPVQLEILRRAGAMPVSSRRCGMITRREAERLCKSFLGDNAPPRLPDDFAFNVLHECAWGCRGSFLPSRYNSSRAKCIKCYYCGLFFSPNKFIFHSHRIGPTDKYVQPDAANFNSWRRHLKLSGSPDDFIVHSWEDVKAMFNGGTRKRMMVQSPISRTPTPSSPKKMKESPTMSPPLLTNSVAPPKIPSSTQLPIRPANVHKSTVAAMHSGPVGGNSASVRNVMPQVFQADLPLPFSRSFMDYMWHQHQNPQKAATAASLIQFPSYALPWLKRPPTGLFPHHQPPPAMTADQPPLNGATNLDPGKQLSFYNNSSAFKPVLSVRKEEDIIKPPAHIKHYAEMSDEEAENRTVDKRPVFKEYHSSDDEMVDIETTDDDYCEPTTTTKAVPVDVVRGGTPMGNNNNNDSYCRVADSPVDSSTVRRQHDGKLDRCCNDDEEPNQRRCTEYSEEIEPEPIALKTTNHSPPIINLSSFGSSEISSLSSASPSSTVSSSSSIANRKNFNNNNKSNFNNNNGVSPQAIIPTTVSGQLWSVANLAHSNHTQHRPGPENDENNSFGMLNARCLSAASFYRHHSPPLSESFLLKNFSASMQHRHSESHSPPQHTPPSLSNQQTYI